MKNYLKFGTDPCPTKQNSAKCLKSKQYRQNQETAFPKPTVWNKEKFLTPRTTPSPENNIPIPIPPLTWTNIINCQPSTMQEPIKLAIDAGKLAICTKIAPMLWHETNAKDAKKSNQTIKSSLELATMLENISFINIDITKRMLTSTIDTATTSAMKLFMMTTTMFGETTVTELIK